MCIWQGVAMDYLKFHPCLPCPSTVLRLAGEPTLKWPYSHFRGGPSTEQAAYGRFLPLWTPHAVRLCSDWQYLYQQSGDTVGLVMVRVSGKHVHRRKILSFWDTWRQFEDHENTYNIFLTSQNVTKIPLERDLALLYKLMMALFPNMFVPWYYRLARLIRAWLIRFMAIKCCS
jgi:hypothetical protein